MKLKVDIKKVIKLLAKDIYDSPYALLRENLQNAYDAILMRKALDSTHFNPCIKMIVSGDKVIISDNGVGMTLDVVENNYWKAGSSGKNNEEARRAGVVGTFGIGAMANFGVCYKLEVVTRYYASSDTIKTSLEIDHISLDEDCIDKDTITDVTLPIGTTVTAFLSPGIILTERDALSYLLPYVQYLSIPVYLNDNLISQKDYVSATLIAEDNSIRCENDFKDGAFEYHLRLCARSHTNGLLSLHITEIKHLGVLAKGEIVLIQNGGTIFGLRNGFGLAPLALGSSFRWGGVANLLDIVPTAGRDSLTRESINLIASIVSSVENSAVKMFSQFEACDLNREYLAFVYQHPAMTTMLASKITIRREPSSDRICLGDVQKQMDHREVRYYPGSDETIINMFANENNYLLILSNDGIRKAIQNRYLNHLGIETIPDNVKATDYNMVDLGTDETSIIFRIEYILQSDYLINNGKVYFAEITHNQPVLVEQQGDKVIIHIKRYSNSINYLRDVYHSDYSLFDGFVKDYVRQNLYPRLSSFVPSATRQGADALMRIMKQKKDLFSIEEKELGQVDEVISDYLKGQATLADVHRASAAIYNSQKQIVSADQTGRVEDVVPSVKANVEENMNPEAAVAIGKDDVIYMPQPPLLRLDYETSMKLLKTTITYHVLNNHLMFLALSDKLFDRYSDFFLEPHSTKVIWSTHKVVYVFTHISSEVSMYYDIDLKEPLPQNMTGGHPIKSTTIITKNKIFVPIPSEMNEYFNLRNHQGKLEFYVRFDTLT
jgi:molecular chaperone HtpG